MRLPLWATLAGEGTASWERIKPDLPVVDPGVYLVEQDGVTRTYQVVIVKGARQLRELSRGPQPVPYDITQVVVSRIARGEAVQIA